MRCADHLSQRAAGDRALIAPKFKEFLAKLTLSKACQHECFARGDVNAILFKHSTNIVRCKRRLTRFFGVWWDKSLRYDVKV